MRMRAHLVLLLAACSSSAPPSAGSVVVPGTHTEVNDGNDGGTQDDAGDRSVPLNRVVMKSSHNAFERSEPLFDQLAFHQIRSLEVDIHNKKAGDSAPAGDWFVYHQDVPTQRDTNCAKLSDCIEQVMAFHRTVPKHEVITLLVDLKDPFEGSQSMDALDTLIKREVGDALYAPADMVAHCPSARTLVDSVTGGCTFPTLAALRGRIMVVLTGGSSCGGTGRLATYAGLSGVGRPAFICPGIDDTCAFANYANVKNSVFYNMSILNAAVAARVEAAGFIGRVYGGGGTPGLDTMDMWNEAKGYGAHILATDKVNAFQDGWSSSQSNRAYPFSCMRANCGLDREEQGSVLGMDVRSGDIEGTSDSFLFLHDKVIGATIWETSIATQSSHVEPFAKGCLMARVSATPGSPYFAVCKPADARPVRVQYRTTAGADTTIVEMQPRATWTPESIFFMRLRVNGTTVMGDGSTDGTRWTNLAQATLSAAPELQGTATSGHDSANVVRFLFRNVKRDEGGAEIAFTKTAATALTCVGSCAKQQVFDGVVP
jgi:hypothetical protein